MILDSTCGLPRPLVWLGMYRPRGAVELLLVAGSALVRKFHRLAFRGQPSTKYRGFAASISYRIITCQGGLTILKRLLPQQLDNRYTGHWLGKWLFLIVVLARLAIGMNSTVNTRFVAMSADGIPLDKYAPAAAETVTALFGISGFFLLLLSLFGLLAFFRYRAMIPLLFLLLLVDQLARMIILHIHPIERSGVATANLGLGFGLLILLATLVGLGLSLWPQRQSPNRVR